jgi:hypothetical protein
MLNKLKTKYKDFINEERLVLDYNLENLLHELKSNVITSMLSYLSNTEAYDTDSEANFISLSNTINMLKYPPKNRRKGDDYFNSPTQTEVRIGRLIRKIINDSPDLKVVYEGKAIFRKGEIVFNDFFTGKEFRDIIDGGDKFSFIYPNEISKVVVNINIGDKNIGDFTVMEYMDQSYRLGWDTDFDYAVLKLDRDHGIKTLETVKLEIDITFGGKTIKQITDSDIEKFVNELTAILKMNMAGENSKIDVVSGDDIITWYNSDNYKSSIGPLGSSCMGGKPPIYFKLYTENKDMISLLVLVNDGKLIGRALLWKCDDGEYFMDRVYCLTQYDMNIFTKYANDNGYYYRSNGNNMNIKYFKDNKEITEPKLKITLSKSEFKYYPYLDTICYLDIDEIIISNKAMLDSIELRDTDGKWIEYYD